MKIISHRGVSNGKDKNLENKPIVVEQRIAEGTVLFSTHDHEFAQTIANRIIELTPSGIIDRYMTFEEYMKDTKIKQLRESMSGTT